ncbi:hypothetical protein PACTADRAFT_48948 [Pachysolen tannophilus NRRL Y-2460]|uniref:Fork-head domain-containing protein n=1 Tax=Pachysolen tannophilus NRRL Y-2460 TaxID=669874 RepID=A0A1E4TZU8_PACTA|nr:hypothetical protein PACTADRAFT_48948 [Pachysolen tannophilus NRRL Y-2460]
MDVNSKRIRQPLREQDINNNIINSNNNSTDMLKQQQGLLPPRSVTASIPTITVSPSDGNQSKNNNNVNNNNNNNNAENVENAENEINDNGVFKLPSLTTPPQTVSRTLSEQIILKEKFSPRSPFANNNEKLKKNRRISQIASKSSSLSSSSSSMKIGNGGIDNINNQALLSPAFSSPSTKLKDNNNNNKIPPPEFPKLVTTKTTTATLKKERKQETVEELNRQVPPPEEMPVVIDDTKDFTKKPAYSYAMLIGMAILRAPGRKLTLSQIYAWISDTFKYYKKGDVGWQNSVRHNLSLNKAFIKSAKSKDGKGHYWQIEKGYEYQFYKGKNTKNGTSSGSNNNNANKINSVELVFNRNQIQNNTIDIKSSSASTSSSFTEEDGENDISTESASESEHNVINHHNKHDIIKSTPKSKIIADRGDEMFEQSSKASRNLQHCILRKRSLMDDEYSAEDDEDEDDLVYQPPVKKQSTSMSTSTAALASTAGNLSLHNIPNLQAPSPYWSASASGNRIIFGLLRTPPKAINHSSSSVMTSQSSIFDSPQHHPLSSSITKANKYGPYTSSFSCISNFDLSPIKGTETGPLLEPLTPRFSNSNNYNSISNGGIKKLSTRDSISKTPNCSSSNNYNGNINNNNNKYSSSTGNSNGYLNKTPNFIKTPGSSSTMKKIWNSPSYLDDFYTSPVISRNYPVYNEDDIIARACFGSPNKTSGSTSKDSNSGDSNSSDH